MTFDTDPTHTATTAAEAFVLRRGVCQDVTHIFIAAARAAGIPARYVGGHFFRADGVTVQEAGHAWAEAHVDGLGWVGFDPTNGISPADAHVRVAVGLDYLGAAPVRGTRYGGLGEVMRVDGQSSTRRSASRNPEHSQEHETFDDLLLRNPGARRPRHDRRHAHQCRPRQRLHLPQAARLHAAGRAGDGARLLRQPLAQPDRALDAHRGREQSGDRRTRDVDERADHVPGGAAHRPRRSQHPE